MSPLASKKLINPFHKLFLSRQDLQYSSPIKPTSAVLVLHPEKESITIFIKILSEYIYYIFIFSDKPGNGGTQGILLLFRRKHDHGTQF